MRQANLPLSTKKPLPSVTLLHGNCLEIMPTLPAKSVQMVFADLPYGCTSARWDIHIDIRRFWACLAAISCLSGPYILTAQQPFLTAIIDSNYKQFRYDLVWLKNRYAGFMAATKAPLRAHESIAIFGKTSTYNPQMTSGHLPYKVTSGPKPHICELNGAVATAKTGSSRRFPLSFQHFRRDDIRNGSGHPTQKPVALLEWLIRTYTNEGDTVLDPTAGSGTTAIAAMRTGRHSICIEKDDHYFAVMQKRVADERARLESE